METKAKRTLVKSAPELWELADDESRMAGWGARLAGTPGEVAVRVTHRDPSRSLAWSVGDGVAPIQIELELAGKGFGTAVHVTVRHEGAGVADPASVLEGLLDELGSPERQPFVA